MQYYRRSRISKFTLHSSFTFLTLNSKNKQNSSSNATIKKKDKNIQHNCIASANIAGVLKSFFHHYNEQARRQALGLGGAKCIFRGSRFLFLLYV